MVYRCFTLCVALLLAGIAFCDVNADDAIEKPTGFSGYLLDATGLDPQEKEAAWREDYESDGVSWRRVYQDGAVKTSQKRVEDEARDGSRVERIAYKVEEPGVVVLGHYVDYPSVFNETAPSLWIRSDRPGVAIAALVVFPKTTRPDLGKPLVAIAPGDVYRTPGEWKKLGFSQGLANVVEKTAQGIRGEHKIPVNVDGAYVRQILLVSEARSGSYVLWIDDLEIAEHIRPEIENLKQWERNAAFDPINLLSCRLQLSNAPIFVQNDVDETDLYGREPFGLDEEKVAEAQKVRLEFDESVLPRGAKETRTTERLSNPSFDAAYALLTPTYEDYVAALPELRRRIPKTLEEFNAQRALAARGSALDSGVGHVGFFDGKQDPNGKIASASFDASASAATQDDALARNVETQNAQDHDDLVLGSGTLADPADAVDEAFAKRGEKLVANAKFHKGLLETPDERVYFIRAIEYQGESLQFLQSLGFNAVWLNAAPNASILQEARDVGIWLIAPPPTGDVLVTAAALEALKSGNAPPAANVEQGNLNEIFGGRRIDDAYDGVLLWNLGSDLRRSQVDALQNRVAKIRSLDPLERPTIGSALTGVDEYAQDGRLNALLLKRAPMLTSLDMNDYGEWLLRYQDLATNPRAVFWNSIQTQPAPTATLQRQFFSMVDESPGIVSYEQMRQQLRQSMRAKCRGFVFTSYSRLDGKDHKTQYRAAALEALNLELQLLNPWCAAGSADRVLLSTSAPSLAGVVSRTKRTILVAPVSIEPHNQYVMGQNAAYNWSATVVAKEGYSPDLLTPGALRKIIAKRQAGGSRFTLDEGSMNSLLFFTQSDVHAQKMSERAPVFGERMARLAVSLARKRLDLYEQTVYGLHYVEEHGLFPKSAPSSPELGAVVERAGQLIDDAELYLNRRDASQAYLVAERATREIRNAERRFWLEATQKEKRRPVTPLSTSFYDMPAYLELYDKLLSKKIRSNGVNLIGGGNMEDAAAWKNAGWSVYQEPSEILRGEASFDSKAAKSGDTGLRVNVSPINENVYVPAQTEAPIVYVETPFNVHVGALVCIQGWIKIPNDISASVDGVEIYDDQGGEALALRYKEKTEWTQFAFYRRATSNGLMRVRFAFTGVGDVYIDDVAAYVVE